MPQSKPIAEDQFLKLHKGNAIVGVGRCRWWAADDADPDNRSCLMQNPDHAELRVYFRNDQITEHADGTRPILDLGPGAYVE